MEQRIRVSWSPDAKRSWCPGSTESSLITPPAALPTASGIRRTSFVRFQQLLVRLRKHEPVRAEVPEPGLAPTRDL